MSSTKCKLNAQNGGGKLHSLTTFHARSTAAMLMDLLDIKCYVGARRFRPFKVDSTIKTISCSPQFSKERYSVMMEMNEKVTKGVEEEESFIIKEVKFLSFSFVIYDSVNLRAFPCFSFPKRSRNNFIYNSGNHSQ